MLCKKCNLLVYNLTRFKPKLVKFCSCISDYPNKYHFDRIKIGERKIYPWTNEDKCYNYNDSNKIQTRLRDYKKKYGGKFYVRRHLAGMEVGRLVDDAS
jgi:hypothetical protein